jgi:hypothetical protein
MTARKQKTRRNRKTASSILTSAERREVERQTYEQVDREPQLPDASSGGAYFLNQADRLHKLAGVLATLMEDFYDQADDLRWDLRKIEPLVHSRSRRSHPGGDDDVVF